MRKPILVQLGIPLLLLLVSLQANGQFRQRNYLELSRNEISGNDVCRAASLSSLKIKFLSLEAGITAVLPGPLYSGLPGFSFSAKGEKKFNRLKMDAELFYRHQPYSQRIQESNFGILIGVEKKHLSLHLGNNTRSYRIRKNFWEQMNGAPQSARSIYEYRNLLYRIAWKLRPENNKRWNITLAVGNYDFFLIEQELNPMAMLRLEGMAGKNWSCFMDFWYQSAGFWNEQINHFGFTLRAGMVWEL